MRVLITHDSFPPIMRGGGELVVYNTARLNTERGIRTEVVTTGDPSITEYASIPTHRLPRHRYLFNFADSPIASAAQQADLIQTYNYHGCLPSLRVGRRLGKPVVCMVLGLFGRQWRRMKPFWSGRMWESLELYQLGRPFDRIAFLSDYSRQEGIRLGADPHRCSVVVPGIELDKFRPGAKEDLVLFTGKFEDRKGVFEIVEAARALPDVRFRMYGWGPAESRLRQIAPPNLEIETFTESSGLPAELARASICLLPSKAETFGFVLVQAMASGCAVISSIPLPFAGESVPSGDTGAIAQAVRKLWRERRLREDMGRRNVELAAQYTWERFGDELSAVYDDVLRDHRK